MSPRITPTSPAPNAARRSSAANRSKGHQQRRRQHRAHRHRARHRRGLNALIAPHIPYGVTGAMAPYPGALHVPEEAFRPYLRAILDGLARNGFRRIVILNGHGGPQTAILEAVAREVAFAHDVQTMTINWWSLCSDVTLEVFGTDGGHAGVNETAFVQAINPRLVHRELYTGKDMATANPAPGAWSATPFPSTITLYKPGQGWPTDFDQKRPTTITRSVWARSADW